MNWDEGLQLMAANYYPECPQPDQAIGIPPHTDHGLVTLLIQNQMGGLQVQHKGKWVNWNGVPNAFVVNLGDQMQVHNMAYELVSGTNIYIYIMKKILK